MADLLELRPYSYGELEQIERPERVFYLRPFVAAGQVCMLTAQPGVGKSYLSQLMSVLMAVGGNWHDIMVADEPVPVLYFMTEGGIDDIDERNEGPVEMGLTDSPFMQANWYVSWRVPLNLMGGDLQAQGALQLLKNFIRAHGIKVVFFDSLYSSMAGDPSNGPDAQKVAKTVSELRMEFPEVAWVIIHHDHRERQDKDGNVVDEEKPYLGHTFIEAMLDQMWNLRKDHGGRSVRFSQIKGRSRHQSIDSFHIELDKATGVLRPTGATVTANTLAVRSFFQNNSDRPITTERWKDFIKSQGISEGNAYKQRQTLMDDGLIRETEEGVQWVDTRIEGLKGSLAVNP